MHKTNTDKMKFKKRSPWKSLFVGLFDYNRNNKVDWWEYIMPVLLLSILDIITGIIANLLSTWVF